MDNVVSILVDSISWQAVGTHQAAISPTPFLDSLRAESVTAERLYAQGPYTDAAAKALFTGEDTLSNFAYYFRLNRAANNHFSLFHENGYETFGFFYPFFMYGDRIKRDIDHVWYTSGFEFNSEWGGTYYYYAQLFRERPLTAEELVILHERIGLMFEVWIGFYEDLKEKPETGELLTEELRQVDLETALKKLKEQSARFANDPEGFIPWFLSDEGKAYFCAIDGIDIDLKIQRAYIRDRVYAPYKSFFRKAARNQFRANVFSNRIRPRQLARMLRSYFKTREVEYLKPAYQYLSERSSIRRVMRDYSSKKWQYVPSAARQLRFVAKALSERRSDKPFYASVHLEDLHGNINFFTHDLADEDLTAEEMTVLSGYVEALGANFKGNLAYLLSLRYTDFCIERFVKSLKEQGVWDKTTLLVVADHGNTNIGYPIHERGRQTNCFYDENYHIPLFLRSAGRTQKTVTGYCNSKDVLPTLLQLVGIEKSASMPGRSLLEEGRHFEDYVITEYMGPGCPDMFSREIWFSIRNEDYVVGYLVKATGDFSDGRIVEVYDLHRDPKCQFNCVESVSAERIAPLLEKLRARFDTVHDEVLRFREECLKQA